MSVSGLRRNVNRGTVPATCLEAKRRTVELLEGGTQSWGHVTGIFVIPVVVPGRLNMLPLPWLPTVCDALT